MDLARLACFDHKADGSPKSLADQVMMDGGRRQKSRNGDAIRTNHAIGKDDDVVAAMDRRFCTLAKPLERFTHTGCALLHRIGDVERSGVERIFQMTNASDLLEVLIGQDRLAHFEAVGSGPTVKVE